VGSKSGVIAPVSLRKSPLLKPEKRGALESVKINLMVNGLRFVFFDVGNTLLFPNRERILAPLHERKIVPTDEQLRLLEIEVKRKFDDSVEHGGRADHGFWSMFYVRLFEILGLKDDEVRQQLVAGTRNSANWDQPRPGTREALAKIREKYKTAVISNSDGKIADVVARAGIADGFLSITDSGIVGKEKPHPLIFETALKSVGALPAESLYVGDVYSVDYLGSTKAGMQAVLFDVAGAYRDKGVPRVESLGELVERLM
jgi:FMN phosphatase YigB (HAD superfamily)